MKIDFDEHIRLTAKTALLNAPGPEQEIGITRVVSGEEFMVIDLPRLDEIQASMESDVREFAKKNGRVAYDMRWRFWREPREQAAERAKGSGQ